MPSAFERCFVRITASGGAVAGAGFVVSDHGDILTCAHVLTGALGRGSVGAEKPSETFAVDLPFLGHDPLSAEVHTWMPLWGPPSDPRDDIAVLRVVGDLPDEAQAASLLVGGNLFDHSFRAYGYPHGHDAGIFAYGQLRDRLSNGWLQVEDTKGPGRRVERGYSGGPVQDRDTDRIVGMVVASTTDKTDKVAFVIPNDQLARAWPDLPVHRESPGSAVRAKLGASITIRQQDFGGEVLFAGPTALVRLGRDPSSEIVLSQPASWEHGRILLSGGAYVYQQLGRHPTQIRHRTGQVITLSADARSEETLRQADRLSPVPGCSLVVRFELPREDDFIPTA